MTTTPLNLLDEKAVCEELKALVMAEEWEKVASLGDAHAVAKQRKFLADAEAAYLVALPAAQRAHRVSVGRVNLGG